MFFRKDFISMKDLGAEEILYILNTAETMKFVLNQKNKKAPHLQGKSVINLFYEKNMKTRLSYELAAQYLSANIVDITELDEVGGNMELIDMGRTIDQMGGDFIVLRHPMSGAAKLLAENVNAGVINAGDGLNENPSQSLLDLLTIKNQKGGFVGLKVAIIGDVAHSRVTHSNITALLRLGAQVNAAGPSTLLQEELGQLGVNIYYDAREAVADADVIMALRLLPEEQYGNLLPSSIEYKNLFKIDLKLMALAKPDVIIMHPGPIKRGVDISSEIIDSQRCLVNDQISNGVAVRMALLYLMSLGQKGGASNGAVN
jgi:aspartate carbamoyltransferase catalytic subunit